MYEIVFLAIIGILLLIVFVLYRKMSELSVHVSDLSFSKQSQSVKYGKMSENWIPLSEKFPYSKEKFRFLGNPIDGIAFEEDKIVFCEFKAGNARLTQTQEHIRELIRKGNVEWHEFNVKEGN